MRNLQAKQATTWLKRYRIGLKSNKQGTLAEELLAKSNWEGQDMDRPLLVDFQNRDVVTCSDAAKKLGPKPKASQQGVPFSLFSDYYLQDATPTGGNKAADILSAATSYDARWNHPRGDHKCWLWGDESNAM